MTDPIVPAYKTCRKCGEIKPMVGFYRRSASKDGFYNYCKACHDLHVDTMIKLRSKKFYGTPLDPNATKVCYRCKEAKPLRMFSRNRRNIDGYAYLCGHCSRERARRLYLEIKKERDGKSADLHGVKVCGHCGEERPKDEFYKSIGRRTGLHSWCRKCVIKKNRDTRYKTLLHYSGNDLRCRCCRETTVEFLALDHINGGGNQERKRIGRMGSQFCAYLRNLGYPKGYQVLCHNCNLVKGYYGHCPHTCTHTTH